MRSPSGKSRRNKLPRSPEQQGSQSAGPSKPGSVGNQVMGILGLTIDQLKFPEVLGAWTVGGKGRVLSSCGLANVFSLFLLSIPWSLLSLWATWDISVILCLGLWYLVVRTGYHLVPINPSRVDTQEISLKTLLLPTRCLLRLEVDQWYMAYSSPKAWPLCLWWGPQRTVKSPAGVCLGLQRSVGLLSDNASRLQPQPNCSLSLRQPLTV